MGRKEKAPKYVERESIENLMDVIIGAPIHFKPRTQSQENFIKTIKEHEITICSGSPGTGKSMCALATALELVKDPKTKYKKIVIATPLIEADESIGFLPGTASEKAAPYMASSFGLIDKMIGEKARKQLIEQGVIQIEILSFIRGCSWDNTIFVGEEIQNTTPAQMKTILSRIGDNSKLILSGDLEQSDRYFDGKNSGLYDALTRLRPIEEIGFYEFGPEDIVRNKIIGKILELYKPEPKEEIKIVKKSQLND